MPKKYFLVKFCRSQIIVSPLAWLLQLSSFIEILCPTSSYGKTLKEVAATCINYKDYENQKVRRSFSFQFHPELLSDLREFHITSIPDFQTLKKHDGIRKLMRILYKCILD